MVSPVIALSAVKATGWLVFLPHHLHETTSVQPVEVYGQQYVPVCLLQASVDL